MSASQSKHRLVFSSKRLLPVKQEAWLDFSWPGWRILPIKRLKLRTEIAELFKEDRKRITMESDRAGSDFRIHELSSRILFTR